jgi:hypothetical protein
MFRSLQATCFGPYRLHVSVSTDYMLRPVQATCFGSYRLHVSVPTGYMFRSVQATCFGPYRTIIRPSYISTNTYKLTTTTFNL